MVAAAAAAVSFGILSNQVDLKISSKLHNVPKKLNRSPFFNCTFPSGLESGMVEAGRAA
jgi:hypothetical protein